MSIWDFPACHTQHVKSLALQISHLLSNSLAALVCQGVFLCPLPAAGAVPQHGAGCPLGKCDQPSIPGMDGGHHLPFGTEWDLVPPRGVGSLLIQVQPRTQGCLDQGCIHRVALHLACPI